MKIFAILTICLGLTVFSIPNIYSQKKENAIEKLAWMSGCWIQNGKNQESFISENWTKPLGMMIGTNRSVRDGKVGAFEFLRIESRDEGIFYVARPSGASMETSFKMKVLEKERVVFENKDHDFPKRIIYSVDTEGSLTARAEDDTEGFGFRFKKVSCDE